MKENSQKKSDQLGMPIGTASNRLRKSIIFMFLKELNKNFCFQCGKEIKSEKELSIEHKIPYLDSQDPKKLFFDLDNIGFSHLNCNIGARRSRPLSHPSITSYNRGCRCNECRKLKVKNVMNSRRNTKLSRSVKATTQDSDS